MQIAEYADGGQRIVKHFGSAHSVAELGILVQRAQDFLIDQNQLVLDIDAPVSAMVTDLLGPPSAPALFDPAVDPPSVRRDGAGRVVGTDSRVLFGALSAVYADLGFDTLGDRVFRDLVLARVVEPTSLLDSGRVVTDLGQRPASYATCKRTLKRVVKDEFRDDVAKLCFEHASASGDISLVLYDVTTLYFEAEKEDGLRKVGYSNYADVMVMPSPMSSRWCRCRSTGFPGVDRAA